MVNTALRVVRRWDVVVPPVALLVLVTTWGRSVGPFALTVVALALVPAVVAAVHHAEVVAPRVGEPFGTLILAVAVTVIEVGLIVMLMSAGGKGAATLARDTVFAAFMIVCNGVVGICLLVGALRHRVVEFRVEGVTGALATLSALATLALVLPSFTTSTPGPTFSTAQLAFAGVASLVLYGTFVFVQTVRHRNYFLPVEPDPAANRAPRPASRPGPGPAARPGTRRNARPHTSATGGGAPPAGGAKSPGASSAGAKSAGAKSAGAKSTAATASNAARAKAATSSRGPTYTGRGPGAGTGKGTGTPPDDHAVAGQPGAPGSEDDVAAPPTARAAAYSLGLLFVCLVGVVGLAKTASPTIEAGVAAVGAPQAVVGVAIALLVLLPETVAAVRAASRNRIQTSFNLALGSALASIGLTIPTIAIASSWLPGPLVLGLGPKEMVLMAITVVITTLTVAPGRATLLQGTVHLVVFGAFLFLAVTP